VSITYSESVFVALVIQHAIGMGHIVTCSLSVSTVFFHIITQTASFIHSFIHSFISSLSYDRSKASSKENSPQSAIQSFLLQIRVSSPFLKVIQ